MGGLVIIRRRRGGWRRSPSSDKPEQQDRESKQVFLPEMLDSDSSLDSDEEERIPSDVDCLNFYWRVKQRCWRLRKRNKDKSRLLQASHRSSPAVVRIKFPRLLLNSGFSQDAFILSTFALSQEHKKQGKHTTLRTCILQVSPWIL